MKVENNIERKVFFFISWLSFIVLMSEQILRKKELSLTECIKNKRIEGFAIYAFIMIISLVIAYFFLQVILKGKSERFLICFCSRLFWAIMIFTIIKGSLKSIIYIIIWGLCFVTSLITIIIHKDNYQTDKKKDIKEFLKYFLPYVLFFIVTMYIYYPLELLFNNKNDFAVIYYDYIIVIICYSIFITLLIIAGFYIAVTSTQLGDYSATIFAFSFGAYLQGNFLNGKMNQLDGTVQEWSNTQILINLIIWAAVFILSYVLQRKKENVLRYAAIYISLIQIVTLAIVGIKSEKLADNRFLALTTKDMFELGQEENCIIFVLDWYDNQIIDQITKEKEDFLNPLNDFTYYNNCTSLYGFTDFSIPYLITGVEREEEMLGPEYKEKAFSSKKNIINQCNTDDYDIGIYTYSQYVTKEFEEIISNLSSDVIFKCDLEYAIKFLERSTRYKMSIFGIKYLFNYSDVDVSLILEADDMYNASSNFVFKEMLDKQHINIKKDCKKAYRFYHLFGAHSPFYMNENMEFTDNTNRKEQAIGSMKVVYRYIDELKKAGLYDDATIIITADHGQNTMLNADLSIECEEDSELERVSSPILFVKKAKQTQDKLVINTAPVSHKELVTTIKNVLNISTEDRSLSDIKENEERSRVFEYFRVSDIPYTKYIINGDVKDIASWAIE